MTESQTESLFAAVGGEGEKYVLPVAVRNRIAVYCSREKLILGNSDYRLRFDFDGEWDLYPTKTVRLRFVDERGQFIIHNILLEGEECWKKYADVRSTNIWIRNCGNHWE